MANGGRDDSPALKITWRNIKAMENEGLPFHAYTVPRPMKLKAGHDYRISFWSNADATARLDISVRALPDYHICLVDKYDVMQDTLLLAKDAGIDFVTTMIECPWPRPGEAADWIVTDTTLDHILAVMPNAKIVPRFKVLAPAWWREEHPDDMFGADPKANFKYHLAVESFCSELWRREAEERIRALIEHVEAKYGANIMDITQSVLSDYFAMIMLTDIRSLNVGFAEFADELAALGKKKHLDIHTMHEDIFNTMHHV